MALAGNEENFHTLMSGAQQLHYYKSADAVATIAASGYFSSITNRIKEHDVILCVGATGGTETVDVLVVTSATGAATVTCTNGT